MIEHIDDSIVWDIITNQSDSISEQIAYEHFSVCTHCRESFNMIRLLHEESYHIEKEVPSPIFSISVLERIKKEIAVEKTQIFWSKCFIYALFSALVLAITTLLVLTIDQNNMNSDPINKYLDLLPTFVFLTILSWIFYFTDKIIGSFFNKNEQQIVR